ncbi:MAG: WecB/TagA/CpsF family glycosyltransferase [Nitrospira sp. CR2.1]|nr:WecB/TagA/CpsF family glycosyltransferase [Nitrospira sp. CR2.1]MBA5875052.1 WecB/TagA/CpsF family glycosyltransferase [Nitrospira sp. CR1.2]
MERSTAGTTDRPTNSSILLGVQLGMEGLPDLTREALAAVDSNRSQVVFVCANPHSLAVAQTDIRFREALSQAEQVVADGVGITLMARLARVRCGPRITGHDYFYALLNALQQRGQGRIFFFGSSQRVLDLIVERFRHEFPALTLCGIHSPPFGAWSEDENTRMIRLINDAQPDVLWVGMTAPKQETWVQTNRKRLRVPVIGSIGAVFDFYAGTHPRSPRWICRLGLEWVYRFVREPRRMWRRNFVSAPKFIGLIVWRHILGFSK